MINPIFIIIQIGFCFFFCFFFLNNYYLLIILVCGFVAFAPRMNNIFNFNKGNKYKVSYLEIRRWTTALSNIIVRNEFYDKKITSKVLLKN